MVSPSYLEVPLPQIISEAGPWHKTGWGGGWGEEVPHSLGSPQSGVGVLPGADTAQPHESTLLGRFWKKGKKEAAPAATQQDTRERGERGSDTKHTRGEGQRKRSGKEREKAERRRDALRKEP